MNASRGEKRVLLAAGSRFPRTRKSARFRTVHFRPKWPEVNMTMLTFPSEMAKVYIKAIVKRAWG